jgi:hypothetical protein
MIEDDGGFMGRKVSRNITPDWEYCDWCDDSIENKEDEIWDLETGGVFCCDECKYQYDINKEENDE